METIIYKTDYLGDRHKYRPPAIVEVVIFDLFTKVQHDIEPCSFSRIVCFFLYILFMYVIIFCCLFIFCSIGIRRHGPVVYFAAHY